MRILYLNSNYKHEGTYNRCFRLARQLVKRGVQVTLMTTTDCPPALGVQRQSDEGVDLIELPALTRRRDYGGYLVRPAVACRVASREPFDLVHAFTAAEPQVWFPASMLHRRRKRHPFPLMVDWDDWYSRGGLVEMKPARWLLRSLTARWEESLPQWADAVTVVSEALQQRALELGIPSEKIHLVGNGADPAPYERLDSIECRKKLNLPQEGVLALYMGHYNQALPLAIRAFLKAAEANPQARFVCVGDVSIRHHHLQADAKMIRQARKDSRFHFTGRVGSDKVPDYLAAADVLLLPMADNLIEKARFPIRLGDYLSAGKAIIASEVGEVGRILKEHDCALLAHDEDEWVRRLSDLLANPDRCIRLGLLARRTAQNHLHWSLLAEKMLSIYQSFGLQPGPKSKS